MLCLSLELMRCQPLRRALCLRWQLVLTVNN
ncbi:acetyltransferase [Vibrio cholerae]|nr:acetyltransferase [Vibrio paracholerae]TXY15584.1 acetyltransferase [Vibrio cholerae]TXY22635.1 acetyltransferase [Vibrio cholerae]TXY55706.1 acetyltransferase [Vibrio cholerae]TXY62069.1 acetyltransferase [Vibrio cholerae]